MNGRSGLSARKKVFQVCAALAWLAIPVPGAVSVPPAPPTGLVVEEARAGTAAHKAGLLPGDVLLSWRREPVAVPGLPAAGELALPFDLVEVFLEQMPRAQVTLLGRRGPEEKSWVLPRGAPSASEGVRTVPLLSGELLALHGEARAQLEAGDSEAGVATLRLAASSARAQGAGDLAVWFLAEAARKLAWEQRWEEADTFYQEALFLEASPRKLFLTAQLYREWGKLFDDRFSWQRADECFRRAWDADRQKGFASLAEAWDLTSLARIDVLSTGPRDQEGLYREAREIRHRLAPGSAEDATSWLQWGHAARWRSDWSNAAERYRRAIEILEKNDASRLLLADALANLGQLQAEQKELKAAQESLQRAYSLGLQEAPEDYLIAGITRGLGSLAAGKGDLQQAEQLLSRSLEVCRRHRPGSLGEADALRELGLVQVQNGKREIGSQHLCQSLDVIYDWRLKLRANQELRNGWSQFSTPYHRDCAESLVELRRAEEAFLAIEKGRARAFLDLRAERGLRLAALAPERSLEWRKLNAEYERAQEELSLANARKDSTLEQIVDLQVRLREVRRKKERLLERDLPPGSVHYPEPLSLAEARRKLEPGTVMLSYSVGRTKTLLFVLTPEGEAAGWTAVPLSIGNAELKKKVQLFLKTLVEDRLNRPALSSRSQDLYDLLISPAERYLAGAERIVVSPDGPLQFLPFAALKRGERYLVERKPLHFTLSATVYAEQLAQRSSGTPSRGSARLVAFGDPFYAQPLIDQERSAADPPVQQALGQGVPPLPATRKEVEGIAGLFPGAQTLIGDQVTEERVREAVSGASLIHFAVHGLLNEQSSLASALVLSPSGKPGEERKNGLLTASKVMESLHLDADLVTLSACNTALGRAVEGEGLIGLTRAFQHAGARSVIATLWAIPDRSTAGFMMELYGALRAGKSKDEALRAAQLAQIRSSSKSQPFYWAAFQLFGDWQ